jgi:hypothetical protein
MTTLEIWASSKLKRDSESTRRALQGVQKVKIVQVSDCGSSASVFPHLIQSVEVGKAQEE